MSIPSHKDGITPGTLSREKEKERMRMELEAGREFASRSRKHHQTQRTQR